MTLLDLSNAQAVRVGLGSWQPAATRLVFPRVAGNYLSMANIAGAGVTDYEVVARASHDTWNRPLPTGFHGIESDALFGLRVSFWGDAFDFYEVNSPFRTVSAPIPTYAPGQAVWLRGRFTSTTMTLDHSTADSPDEPSSWTNLASLAVSAPTDSLPYSTYIGMDNALGPVDRVWGPGRIMRVIVRIGGAAVLDMAETDPGTPGVTSFTATSGQTVTVNQTGSNVIVQGGNPVAAADVLEVRIADTTVWVKP